MYYKLNNDKSVSRCSLIEWSNQLDIMIQTDTKHVAKDTIGEKWISTVFFGLDHKWDDDGCPLIFETMIIDMNNNEWENYQTRYSTYEEAIEGHQRAIDWVKNGCKDDEKEE